MNVRIAIGFIRVELCSQLIDRGINLYRRNRIDTMRQCERSVRSGPGSKNQGVVERPAAEYAVYLLVEWFLVLPANHLLMPGAVYIDEVAIVKSRVEDDFIVW